MTSSNFLDNPCPADAVSGRQGLPAAYTTNILYRTRYVNPFNSEPVVNFTILTQPKNLAEIRREICYNIGNRAFSYCGTGFMPVTSTVIPQDALRRMAVPRQTYFGMF